LGAFLAQSAKNRAFRFNLLATPKGFPLQSLARPKGFQDIEQALRSFLSFKTISAYTILTIHSFFYFFDW
jgi:hypothetical protein